MERVTFRPYLARRTGGPCTWTTAGMATADECQHPKTGGRSQLLVGEAASFGAPIPMWVFVPLTTKGYSEHHMSNHVLPCSDLNR